MLSRRVLLAAAAAAPLVSGCAGDGAPRPVSQHRPGEWLLSGVTNVTQVAQLTGPGAINDTSTVLLAGADLGSMFTAGERTYFLFGDNFGIRADDAVGGTGEVWKSNCLAWSTDDNPADGITFDGWILDDLDQVKEILPGDHHVNDGSGEVTKIPTQGWAMGEDLFAGYMSVSHWGEPGVWTADHAGLARSTDGGQNWQILPDVRWAGDSDFVQLAHAFVRDDDGDQLYLWGIPAGRFGSVKLMRVRADAAAVADPAAYQYFAGADDGRPRWSAKEADAAVVHEGQVGELSVMWSTYLSRWILTTMLGNGDAVVLEGQAAWGPWGEPHTITTQAETAGLYAPYLSPRHVADDGRRVYFTLSIWGPYQVYWYAMDLQRGEA